MLTLRSPTVRVKTLCLVEQITVNRVSVCLFYQKLLRLGNRHTIFDDPVELSRDVCIRLSHRHSTIQPSFLH